MWRYRILRSKVSAWTERGWLNLPCPPVTNSREREGRLFVRFDSMFEARRRELMVGRSNDNRLSQLTLPDNWEYNRLRTITELTTTRIRVCYEEIGRDTGSVHPTKSLFPFGPAGRQCLGLCRIWKDPVKIRYSLV